MFCLYRPIRVPEPGIICCSRGGLSKSKQNEYLPFWQTFEICWLLATTHYPVCIEWTALQCWNCTNISPICKDCTSLNSKMRTLFRAFWRSYSTGNVLCCYVSRCRAPWDNSTFDVLFISSLCPNWCTLPSTPLTAETSELCLPSTTSPCCPLSRRLIKLGRLADVLGTWCWLLLRNGFAKPLCLDSAQLLAVLLDVSHELFVHC